jgi:hypothetical protein
VSVVVFIIALSAIPSELHQWAIWLRGINENVARWVLVGIGLVIMVAANGSAALAAWFAWTLRRRARSLSKEILGFLAGREASTPPMPPRPETWHEDTQAMVRHMNETGILGTQKFGSRMIAMHHELAAKGLQDPQLDRFMEASAASMNGVVIRIAAERFGALAERLP